MNILILNGPNLNLLGKRNPEIYGNQSFNDYFKELTAQFTGHYLEYFQSNHEGAIIDKLHEVGFSFDGIVLNAGGYTHTSVAIRDAVDAIETPVYEVHISNIYEREFFRRHSYLEEVCRKSIVGKGLGGYAEAVGMIVNGQDV